MRAGSARIAAIDIGTVTTRLLVADVSPDAVVEVERSTDITHLGEGLTETGVLSGDAMTRVAEVIAGYARRIEALGVATVRAVATSASRDAANSDQFAALLAAAGIEPQVIAGAREAELAFRGATAQRTGERLLVVDCGGGSTELVFGDATRTAAGVITHVEAARSIDVGSRRMTERFLHADPPSATELDAARAWAVAEFRPFFDRLEERPSAMIGLAGTATTLAAIRLELAEYDAAAVHGYELSGHDLADLLELLASLPLEARRKITGLHPGRAGVIVAGTLIFETLLALAGSDRMIVSEHDILYGILLDAYDASVRGGQD